VVDEVWQMEFDRTPMPSPYNDLPFLIFEELVPKDECKQVIESFKKSDFKARLRGGGLNEAMRKTTLLEVTSKAREIFEGAIQKVKEQIERFYNISLFGGSQIQALYYKDGGFYHCHADNASRLEKDGTLVGYKIIAPKRKVTTLLFLNDDFEGGELEFCHLRYFDGSKVIIEPKAGSLVSFASHPIFAHEVKPVKGERYALVKWWEGF